jgi:aminoglycoside phosphotransferase (APT) family kinase protein
MTSIPTTIDEVTPAWVADATGLAVTGVEHEIIGVGVGVSSAVYRLRLQGDDVPDTLILKLRALDEAAVFTSSMLRMYQREVKFFDELASRSPIHVPQGFGGGLSDDGATYYLFMQDMGGHRAVDQNTGMSIADAERAVDELAKWHAEFWGDADRYVASGAALSLADDIYQGVLPIVFAEGWEKVKAEMDPHATIAEVAPKWAAQLPAMLSALSQSPTTVVHGDYRADNIFFDDNDDVVLLDFQITGLGSGAYDLAYFVTQSLPPDVAGEHEEALFERYVRGLVAAGVPERDTTRLWDDYRTAALFCLVYPIVASRGMDLGNDRQRELVTTMSNGCARAIDELDLRSLL